MFRVGQKVVCVDSRSRPGFRDWRPGHQPKKGAIYTVRDVCLCLDGSPGIRVTEIIRHGTVPVDDLPYAAARFRPVVSRPTSIEFAHEILRTATRTDEVSA